MADAFVYPRHNQPDSENGGDASGDDDNFVISQPPLFCSVHTQQPQDVVAETGDQPSLLDTDHATGVYGTPSSLLENKETAIARNDDYSTTDVTIPGQHHVPATVVSQDSVSPERSGQTLSRPTARVLGCEYHSGRPGQFDGLGRHPNNDRPLSPCDLKLAPNPTGPFPFQKAKVQTNLGFPINGSPPKQERIPFGRQEMVLGPFDMDNIVFSTRPGTAKWKREVRKRLQTYIGWPREHEIPSRRLAEAGFIFTGRGDSVECVRCRGCLDNWEVGDDPWDQHQKLFQTDCFP